MKNRKEHLKIVIFNFCIMFALYVLLLWILLNLKYSWTLTSREWRYIFITSFSFNFTWNIFLWYQTKYKVIEFKECSKENMEKMKKFLSSKKVKIIDSSTNNRIYKVKHKKSIFPLKFSILSEDGNYLINAPKIIIDEILYNNSELPNMLFSKLKDFIIYPKR
ncbi:MAG: hypothetical protein U9N10_11785 [Bacillota bacterium]|nr:hypothetical protein [Bacillota bacterium]